MTKVVSITFNPFQENTYVVYETQTKEAFIIDPGCLGHNEEQQLFDLIEQLDLQPIRLINTHCHLDHVYGTAAVAEKYGLGLGIHQLEIPVLAAAESVNSAYGLPPMTPPPSPAYFLEEGQQLQLGSAVFDILLTPGHSPGSICFYNAADGYIIAGDVLFQQSIGRTDLPGGDYATLMGSIHGKLLLLPDETVVYPGHGPSTSIAIERASNPFLNSGT